MEIQLQIETTSTCNAACSFCVYPTAERKGLLMPLTLFHKIIDEASSIPYIKEVCLTGLGEPTLDPMLISRVGYTRARMPQVNIGLFTNGVHMTPHRFDFLRDVGISYVVFSLNASTPAQHERQMGLKDKFDVVCANIDHAIAHREKVHIEVRAVVARDYWKPDDTVDFLKKWGHIGNGGFGRLILEGNWAGDNRTLHKVAPNEACSRALGQVYVLADGKVATCCFDPTGKQVFGDLSCESLRDVYNSEKYVKFREDHFNDRADRYEICAKCTRI